jgi:hypothetical protein
MMVSMCVQMTCFVSVSREVMLLMYHGHYVPLLAVAVIDLIARQAHWLLTRILRAMALVHELGCNTGLDWLCLTYHVCWTVVLKGFT